ncbi:hypothetical protein BDB00DRAFT_846604 [Zychaea mexicana]|uniref:uncharacterized protein n=1 Tax=Zychaea mexicana TaxID=64656 RepID=UPI0022FE5011|nr:uncharacterized protein BDB00DRAFT_846604 [Zychaea mexicana]KAI9488796.1 hypothetical protein BDB00DRAFT_846604 [Zychaea mexicana]
MVSFNRLTENLFLLTTGILSLCAWVIAFGGLCAFRQLSGGGYWLIVYELLLILGTLFVFMSGTFLHYRMVLLTFLAVSIAMLMGQIDAVLPVSRFGYDANQDGAGAYAAGYIFIVIIQFLWVFVFGSEPHSYLGQFGHGWSAMNNSVDNHHQHPGMKAAAANPPAVMGAGQVQSTHQQQVPQYEMTTDKTMVPPGGFNSPQSAYEMQAHPAASSPQQQQQQQQPLQSPSSPQQEPPAEYKERVEALHDYSASTDDPSELSFRKGEILEVVERKGNWWQARKADGSMGIIPSNYFA